MPLAPTPPYRAAFPAALIAVIALAVWLAWRISGPLKTDVFFGWLCLLLIVATVAAIAQTSYGTTGHSILRGLLALTATSVVLITTIALAGHLGMNETLTVSVLFTTWLSACAAATRCLRRLGPAPANAIALALATLLMASPVVAIPLVRSAATWGQEGTAISPWQGRIIELIRHTCPFFALLDAVRPAMKIDWSHLPAMYEWSGLGQDIPMLLPNAWISAAVYTATALLMCVPAFIYQSRKESRRQHN